MYPAYLFLLLAPLETYYYQSLPSFYLCGSFPFPKRTTTLHLPSMNLKRCSDKFFHLGECFCKVLQQQPGADFPAERVTESPSCQRCMEDLLANILTTIIICESQAAALQGRHFLWKFGLGHPFLGINYHSEN